MPQGDITEDQAAHIMDLVKHAAIALTEKLGPGNYFGTVYGQLYKLCNITSYRKISQAQYSRAVEFLEKMIKGHDGPGNRE